LFTSGRYPHLPSLNQSRRQKVVEHPLVTSSVRRTIGCFFPLCCMHELSCPASATWIIYLLQTLHKLLISCFDRDTWMIRSQILHCILNTCNSPLCMFYQIVPTPSPTHINRGEGDLEKDFFRIFYYCSQERRKLRVRIEGNCTLAPATVIILSDDR
jgi:hypothetical protein